MRQNGAGKNRGFKMAKNFNKSGVLMQIELPHKMDEAISAVKLKFNTTSKQEAVIYIIARWLQGPEGREITDFLDRKIVTENADGEVSDE